MKVDNAIIMAAGTSSRFAPLSYERHKALIEVKGDILIERQIQQLKQAGIEEIVIVTGYKAEEFNYLTDKYGVKMIHNPDYLVRNNNSSIYAARDCLKNSYVCSADNYFKENPFSSTVEESYYAAVHSPGATKEWCLSTGSDGYINSVTVGGSDAWYMLGHTFWSEKFSRTFLEILEREYENPEVVNLLWEAIYAKHLDSLKMRIAKYPSDYIFEFDTLDELRLFDESYITDTRSGILRALSEKIGVPVSSMSNFSALKSKSNEAEGFSFFVGNSQYSYSYALGDLIIG